MRVIICSEVHEQGVLVAGLVAGLGASVEQVSSVSELVVSLDKRERCRVVIFVGDYSAKWDLKRVMQLRELRLFERLYVVAWSSGVDRSLLLLEMGVDQLFSFPLNGASFRRRLAQEFDILDS